MNIDATPVPGAAANADPDPEATAGGDFALEDLSGAQGKRQVVPAYQLLASLSVLMRSCEGCEKVTVIEVTKLDREDRKDGCNWSLAIVLDSAGVAPEVYGLAYAQVIGTARATWNLE